MNNRIQKTVIAKYLRMSELASVNQREIENLHSSISYLYDNSIIQINDIYSQKIDLILKNLTKDLAIVQRKKVHKDIKVNISKDFYQLLSEDVDGINYENTSIEDLIDSFKKEEFKISTENVKLALENIIIPKRKLTSESELEKYLTNQLSRIFGNVNVHRQYSIGGFLALKTDIDIGNGQVGIELKIIDKLSATDMQRLIGQVVYYTKRFYEKNLIVFVVSKNEMNATCVELKDFIKEFDVDVIHNKAIMI